MVLVAFSSLLRVLVCFLQSLLSLRPPTSLHDILLLKSLFWRSSSLDDLLAPRDSSLDTLCFCLLLSSFPLFFCHQGSAIITKHDQNPLQNVQARFSNPFTPSVAPVESPTDEASPSPSMSFLLLGSLVVEPSLHTILSTRPSLRRAE